MKSIGLLSSQAPAWYNWEQVFDAGFGVALITPVDLSADEEVLIEARFPARDRAEGRREASEREEALQ